MNPELCQCRKKDGTQCSFSKSKKPGTNQQFCLRWHQDCTQIYVPTSVPIKSQVPARRQAPDYLSSVDKFTRQRITEYLPLSSKAKLARVSHGMAKQMKEQFVFKRATNMQEARQLVQRLQRLSGDEFGESI